MKVLIFTGGIVRQGKAVKKITKQTFDSIIAADSGAKEALTLGINPQFVIGDYDSLDTQTLKTIKKSNAQIIKFPQKKNETDTELAIEKAINQGASDITIIGGIEGDRLDHVLANIFLLIKYDTVPICFANGNQKVWLVREQTTATIKGNAGDELSLIPIHENVLHVTTQGLEYPLKDETLFFGKTRGISNVFIAKQAKVTFEKGTLLIVHTAK